MVPTEHAHSLIKVLDPTAGLAATRRGWITPERPIDPSLSNQRATTLQRSTTQRPCKSSPKVRQARLAAQVDHQWTEQSRWLVEAGALIDPAALMRAKDWSLRRLSRATAAGRVFYVVVDGDAYFPSFFVDPRFEGWALDAVCIFLDTTPREHGYQLLGEAKFEFLCTPHQHLSGITPLDAIQLGEVSLVWQAIEQMAGE